MMFRRVVLSALVLAAGTFSIWFANFYGRAGEKAARAAWPVYGGSPARNMANLVDKNIPAELVIEEGKTKNLTWSAPLGSKAYGGPIIADGKVFIGTNEGEDAIDDKEGKATMAAFDEKTGKLLWKLIYSVPNNEQFKEVVRLGMFSSPAVDGKRLYFVTPTAEVVCASTDGKPVWSVDLVKKYKVHPFHCANCSPLVVDDLVLLLTGHGVPEDPDDKTWDPAAPSFLALNKKDGALVWKSSLPGKKILEGQWSNPSLAVIGGKKQVIMPGGDAVIYSFDAATGEPIWKFDGARVLGSTRDDDERYLHYFVATPVVYDNKVYIGAGLMPDHSSTRRASYFFCIDATKKGDVTSKNLDAKDPVNKNSGLVWALGGEIKPRPAKGRPIRFGRTISTCAIVDDLVYISEEAGFLHCLDAKTGERHWLFDLKAGIWGSPYYVDGKIFIGSEDGVLFTLAHGKTLKKLAENEIGVKHGTPAAANGVLYVTTPSKLYAFKAAE